MTHGGWKAPFNIPKTTLDLGILVTTEAQKRGAAKTAQTCRPFLAGMDKAEALAFVSRLFDAAQAGAVSGATPC